MKRSLARLCMALLSALLLGISFPDRSLWLCAWVALVPLFMALSGCGRKEAFLLSMAFGFCFFGIIFQWALIFGVFTWVALSLWQGFYAGLCGAVISPFLGSDKNMVRIVFPALGWVSYEYLRSLGPPGMNLGSVAYTQYTFLPVIQVAAITGMYGVSFMVVLFNTAVVEILRTLPARWKAGMASTGQQGSPQAGEATKHLELPAETVPGAPGWFFRRASALLLLSAFMLPFAACGWGVCRIALDRSREHLYPRLRVSTVQPSLDMCLSHDAADRRTTLTTLEKLTLQGRREGGMLFFWPESAVPVYFPNDKQVAGRICQFAGDHGLWLVAGAPFMGRDARIYNQAFLISPGGEIVDAYAKRHLVPFSENLPFNRYLRKYGPFNRFSAVAPGAAWKTFTTPLARFGALICFESDFPGIARLNVRRGAQFLAVLTNDAWCEISSETAQHMSWGVLRAVENHTYLVQSANTGISAFVDCNGRIRNSTAVFARTVLSDDVILQPAGSFYTWAGDWFPLSCLLAVVVPMGAAWVRRADLPG